MHLTGEAEIPSAFFKCSMVTITKARDPHLSRAPSREWQSLPPAEELGRLPAVQ